MQVLSLPDWGGLKLRPVGLFAGLMLDKVRFIPGSVRANLYSKY